MPLRSKFLLLGGLLQALLVSLLLWNSTRLLDDAITRNADRLAREYAVMLNFSLTPYSSSGRLGELHGYFEEMLTDPKDNMLRYLAVFDDQGRPLLQVGRLPSAQVRQRLQAGAVDAYRQGLKLDFVDSVVHASAPILLTQNRVGQFYFSLSTEDLAAARAKVLHQGIGIGLLSFLLAIFLFYLLTLGIGRRLKALTVQSQRLAAGELGTVLPETGGDEIQVYARSLNAMSLALFERIQQLENSERRLVQSEARFKILFDLAPIPLAVTRPDGTILDLNLATTRVFGFARETALGQDFSRLHLWRNEDETERVGALCSRDGTLHGDNVQAMTQDGRLLELSVWSASLQIDNENTLVWALLDQTEERQAKRELTALNAELEKRVAERSAALADANRELSQTLETLRHTQRELVNAEKVASLSSLVAGIAHELNTPIGNSLLAATALSEDMAAFEQLFGQGAVSRSAVSTHLRESRQYCDLLVSALTKAASLIVAFKQIAVDQTNEPRSRLSLQQLVQDTLSTFKQRIRQANCQIELDIPDSLFLETYADSLTQVFEHLILNALVHAFVGQPSPQIVVRASEQPLERVEIVFQDNGVGMSENVLGHVFDPFFSTKMGQGGSGLGMSTGFNIITVILGGRVHVQSAPAQGTRVALLLPRVAPVHEKYF